MHVVRVISEEECLAEVQKMVQVFDELPGWVSRQAENDPVLMETMLRRAAGIREAYQHGGLFGAVGKALQYVYGDYDRVDPVIRSKLRVSCRPGCYHCCKQLVVSTVGEAVTAVGWLGKQPRKKRRKLLAKMSGWYRRYYRDIYPRITSCNISEKETAAQIYQEFDLYCPFLENGRCSIYPVRPVSCRTYYGAGTGGKCGENGVDKGKVFVFPVFTAYVLMVLGKFNDPEIVQQGVFPVLVHAFMEPLATIRN